MVKTSKTECFAIHIQETFPFVHEVSLRLNYVLEITRRCHFIQKQFAILFV